MAERQQWRTQLLSSSGDGGATLDELAAALGLDGGGYSRLGLKLAGQRASVALEQRQRRDSEEVVAVVLTVKFEGGASSSATGDEAPSIVLRREGEGDARDKERGLTVEVQTGYSGFDHAVFINNDSSEADVRRILSREATRQAVLRLLEAGHPVVRISTTGVSVRQPVENGVVPTEPVLEALEDLLVVARAGGPKDAAPKRRGELLLVLAIAGCTAAVCYGVVASQAWPTTLLLLGLGAVAGGLVAFFSRPAIEWACAGDSSSGSRATTVVVLLAIGSGGLISGGLAHLNGALDDSEGEAWHGEVTSRTTSLRRRATILPRTTVRWEDGSTSAIYGDYSLGDRLTERRHPGALGWEWYDERRLTSR